jgi:hypothetical protein
MINLLTDRRACFPWGFSRKLLSHSWISCWFGTRNFTATVTQVRHWTLSWNILVKFTAPHPVSLMLMCSHYEYGFSWALPTKMHIFLYSIWRFQSGDYEEFYHLEYNAVLSGENQPTFREDISPSSSKSKSKPIKKPICFTSCLPLYGTYLTHLIILDLINAEVKGEEWKLQSFCLRFLPPRLSYGYIFFWAFAVTPGIPEYLLFICLLNCLYIYLFYILINLFNDAVCSSD